MARMSDQERRGLWAKAMQVVSKRREHVPILKLQLRACIDGLDTYVEAHELVIMEAVQNGVLDAFIKANLVAINNAIPEPGRSLLTRPQKEFLFRAVVDREIDDES